MLAAILDFLIHYYYNLLHPLYLGVESHVTAQCQGLFSPSQWQKGKSPGNEVVIFPVAVKDTKIFSKNNDIGVNVFGIEEVMEMDPDGDRLITAKYLQLLTEPTEEYEKVINLFWHDNHFSVVKCLSRLLFGQVSGRKEAKHFCPY